MKFGFVLGLILGLTITFFLFLVLVSGLDANHPLVSSNVIAFLKDVVGPFAAGLGGAAVGALLSSHFQRAHDKTKEDEQILKDYFEGHSILHSKYRELKDIHFNAVQPYADKVWRFLEMPKDPGGSDIKDRAEKVLGPIFLQLGLNEALELLCLCETFHRYCLQNQAQRDAIKEECDNLLNERNVPSSDLKSALEVLGKNRILRLYISTEGFIEVLGKAVSEFERLIKMLDDKAFPHIKKINPQKRVVFVPIKESTPQASAPIIETKEQLEALFDQIVWKPL